MQITISGDIGSGKSTIGAMLAEHYNAELIDCGQLYRKYAVQRGNDVLSQNKSTDTTVDKLIDNEITALGKEGKDRVFVSRTAWHFIPNAVHIYLCVDPILAATRAATRSTVGEAHKSMEETLLYSMDRLYTEDKRYYEMYGITRDKQLQHANIIMNIGEYGIDTVFASLVKVIDAGMQYSYVISPTELVPTQCLRDMNRDTVADYRLKVQCPIMFTDIKLQHTSIGTYILDGHHRVAAACEQGVSYVVTSNVEYALTTEYVLNKGNYYDWEDAFGANLDKVTKQQAELIWCRANAPEALKDESDEDVLNCMHVEYVRYITRQDLEFYRAVNSNGKSV